MRAHAITRECPIVEFPERPRDYVDEAAKNADDRRPRPPAELVDNLEDTAHRELGPSRPARALR